jgi:hypothetical protein
LEQNMKNLRIQPCQSQINQGFQPLLRDTDESARREYLLAAFWNIDLYGFLSHDIPQSSKFIDAQDFCGAQDGLIRLSSIIPGAWPMDAALIAVTSGRLLGYLVDSILVDQTNGKFAISAPIPNDGRIWTLLPELWHDLIGGRGPELSKPMRSTMPAEIKSIINYQSEGYRI